MWWGMLASSLVKNNNSGTQSWQGQSGDAGRATSGAGAINVGGFNVPAYPGGFDLSNPVHAVIAGGIVLIVGAVALKYVRH